MSPERVSNEDLAREMHWHERQFRFHIEQGGRRPSNESLYALDLRDARKERDDSRATLAERDAEIARLKEAISFAGSSIARGERAEAELAALRAAPTDAQHEQDVATVRQAPNASVFYDAEGKTHYLQAPAIAALARLAARPSRDAVLEEAAQEAFDQTADWGEGENGWNAACEFVGSKIRALKSPPTLQAAKEA